MNNKTGPSYSLSLILAFVSGYVDTAVFVHMGGLFVAHVTGNFVLLGATIAGVGIGSNSDTALKLLAFPIFYIGVMATAALSGWIAKAHRTKTLLWLSATMIGLTSLFAFGHFLTDPVLAIILVIAMSMLNAAHRMDPELGPPFTVMTGNVTAVAIATTEKIGLIHRPGNSVKTGSTQIMLMLVIGFTVGCALGAVAQPWLGLGAMITPALVLGARLLL